MTRTWVVSCDGRGEVARGSGWFAWRNPDLVGADRTPPRNFRLGRGMGHRPLLTVHGNLARRPVSDL